MIGLKLNDRRKVKRGKVKLHLHDDFSIKILFCACSWKLIPSVYLAAVRVLPALFVAFQQLFYIFFEKILALSILRTNFLSVGPRKRGP